MPVWWSRVKTHKALPTDVVRRSSVYKYMSIDSVTVRPHGC